MSIHNPHNLAIQSPKAKKIAKSLVIHGDERIDNYYWLNDRENPDVLAYLNEENAYREKMMAGLKDFEEDLFKEIVGRIKQTDMSVPYKMNGYWYYTRFEEGKEYPFYCRKKETLEATEEIMLDVNELAKPHSFYNIGGLSISPDNKILAFGEDTVSRRIYTIKFKNLETGEISKSNVPNTTGSAVWAKDNKTIFYTVKDETLRAYKIFRHQLGQDQSKDVCVFHETDETFGTFCYKTRSKKYIVIGSYQTVSNEYRVLEADNPLGEFRVIQARERNLEYGIAHYEDKFFILTNMNAKNFRLMETSVEETEKNNWKEIIPHREEVLLESIQVFKNHLVLSERIKGIVNVRIKSWDGSEDYYIDFGEDAYVAGPGNNPEFDTDKLRLSYTSMTTPHSVLEYDWSLKSIKVLKEQEVIGDFKKEAYQSERIFVKVRDGAEVPVSLVYKKDMFKRDGTNPILLYAYGSYGHSIDPYFSSVRLSLLDRGFVYAIAHIRGGEELGRSWYEDGKLLNKKNTFYDFIDCGKYLLEQQYGDKTRLFAMGGSAGGLLMGAVVNLAPELWKGVVAAVPFVDVVTTMLDESIPLTTGEFDEWGNPKDEIFYEYIKSYSPYDQVEAKEYPSMLVTTGLHDSQVQYWEPAKWVAKLREFKTDKNALLLYCNMDTGHSGASGRFERFKETAMEYAYLIDLADVEK